MSNQTGNKLGLQGEKAAVKFLQEIGYRILARQHRNSFGEIDIIAESGKTTIFVEVKTRTGDGFGGLEQAVTPRKLRRIRRLAGIWLAGQDIRWRDLRIDVVGVRIGRRRSPEVMHLRGVG